MLQKGDIVRFVDPTKTQAERPLFTWTPEEWRGLFRVRDVFDNTVAVEMVDGYSIGLLPLDAVAIADPNLPCVLGFYVPGVGEGKNEDVYTLSECLKMCKTLSNAEPSYEFWPVLVTDTTDLDTQPIVPLAICPNCVSAMEQTTSGDYVCPRCRYQIEPDNGADTIITRPTLETLRSALIAILKEADEITDCITVEKTLTADREVRDSLETIATIARRVLGGLDVDLWVKEG